MNILQSTPYPQALFLFHPNQDCLPIPISSLQLIQVLSPHSAQVSLPFYKLPWPPEGGQTPLILLICCSGISRWPHTTWSWIICSLGWFLDHFICACLVPAVVQNTYLIFLYPFSTKPVWSHTGLTNCCWLDRLLQISLNSLLFSRVFALLLFLSTNLWRSIISGSFGFRLNLFSSALKWTLNARCQHEAKFWRHSPLRMCKFMNTFRQTLLNAPHVDLMPVVDGVPICLPQV